MCGRGRENLQESGGADESDSIIIGHRFYCSASAHLIYLMIHLDRPVVMSSYPADQQAKPHRYSQATSSSGKDA